MSRRFSVGLVLLLAIAPASVRAQEPPERFLSPNTQVYIKWDGVAAHAGAYKKSPLGAVMAGPTGDSIRALIAKGPKLLGANLLAEPLLEGRSPTELKAVHEDLKNAEKLLDLLLDQGIVVAAEVKEPSATLGGLTKVLGGLLNGEAPGSSNFLPDVRAYAIVPDAGPRADAIFSALQLLMHKQSIYPVPLPAAKARGFSIASADKNNPMHVGWWLEGKHFIYYVGTAEIEAAMKGLRDNASRGGILNNPLYRRCQKSGELESVARGYVDSAAIIQLAVRLAGPFLPDLAPKLNAIGIGNLQSIVFTSGFDGKESRAVYEFDLPGQRQGLAKIIKAKPIALADLPPLPPDVSRFSMLRIDPSGAYDAGLVGVEMLAAGDQFGVEDKAKTPAEAARLRREFIDRELTKFLGFDVRKDLLPNLGDKIAIFQSPSEGVSVFGTVVCISVKDGPKVEVALDRFQRGLQTLASNPLKVRRKLLGGVEIHEIYSRGFGVLTPTYAIVGDWLVIAGAPQPVQGFVLRHQGKLAKWSPDADTAARLANMPSDAIGLQYCNPKSTVQNLCCIGPLVLSALTRFINNRNDGEFDPVDVGLIPNGHELSKHLFPNLTYTRDDGKTVRIEVNESFSLPLEFIGFEPFAAALSGIFGF
ncbi:MAG TPA: hypothetical protein VN641_18485 [Urbifossiella sp.]|nr:hypothetical protein [Urbifossiella sp.]